jgi:hypothetical protein
LRLAINLKGDVRFNSIENSASSPGIEDVIHDDAGFSDPSLSSQMGGIEGAIPNPARYIEYAK